MTSEVRAAVDETPAPDARPAGTKWWRAHSVRMRLTLWYVAAMLIVLGVYVFGVYTVVSSTVSDALDQQLRRDFQWAAASIYLTAQQTITWTEPEDLVAEEGLPWVQVWSANGDRLLFSNSEAQRRPVPASQALASEANDRIVSVPTDTFPIRILSRRGCIGCVDGAGPPLSAVIQVARSEEAIQQQLGELAFILIFGLPLAVAVAGLGGYVLARRALAPIERMTERARSITAERLSDRLPVHNPDDEMGRLAVVFNETLGRLEESFEQMRRFTADVSHELRTPLTAIRSVGEVGLRGHRDEAAYRSIVGSMLEEVDRLARLVDRLLTLSRAETHQAKLAHEVVDLHQLAEDVAAHLAVLAEEKRQAIVIEGESGASAMGDRLALRHALINLVDNAIKFAPEGGRILVRLSMSAMDAIVDVSDSGPGVPAEARARIFDRFYRAEGSEAGGSGLGLSIAKGEVEALGGRLTLEQTGPAGTTFRIALPRGRLLVGKTLRSQNLVRSK